jgi:hypothetical protein
MLMKDLLKEFSFDLHDKHFNPSLIRHYEVQQSGQILVQLL